MKDPLNLEKPWGVIGQMVVIALPIGLIYLIIRLAVVVPEWGWQVILPLALFAPFLYYFLAFRSGLSPKPRDPNAHYTPAQRRLQRLLVVLMMLMLCVPAGLAVYYFRIGALPW